MTTYTPIANGSVDAGSPVDESLVTALRDNPIALSEGAAGAPRIATIAADANDGTTTAGTTAAITNSSVAYSAPGGNTTFDALRGIVNIAGSYTFLFANMTFAADSGANLTVRLFCGSTEVAAATTPGAGLGTLLKGSATHTASAGDVWRLQITGDNGGSISKSMAIVSISTNSGGDCFTRVTDGAIL
jgi:hypothetical protein